MPDTPPKKPKTDAFEGNRQQFYMHADEYATFAKLCEIRGKSVSSEIARLIRGCIRLNAPHLHKAGHAIPPAVFETK